MPTAKVVRVGIAPRQGKSYSGRLINERMQEDWAETILQAFAYAQSSSSLPLKSPWRFHTTSASTNVRLFHCPDASTSIQHIREMVSSSSSADEEVWHVLVCGSLYLVADALSQLDK